jgi:twitching motility protein PilT
MTTAGYKSQEMEMDKLFAHVLEADASDLHLLVGKPPMIRVDSVLRPVGGYPMFDNDALEKLITVLLTDLYKDQLQAKKQVDFAYSFKGLARFRVNVYYQKGTIAAAFRLIPAKIRTIAELNLPAELENFTKYRQGLVLFVGPTGHGKSTTLAALVDIVNHTRSEHIITIEDPIEYLFTQDKSIISQREVYLDTLGFGPAIRATLREDPNVVMVGEMRDLESISTTITVAETGHLVFTTLHTNDAAQTVDRIIDVFPAHQQAQIRSQLANILLGVVSQRLVPRIGGGRLPATEILMSNNAVRNVIREGRTYELPNIIHTSAADGMVSLEKSLADAVRRGLVKVEDALNFANNQDLFRSLVKRF